MGKELKSGINTEIVKARISKSLMTKLNSYFKKANISKAQVIRDTLQALLKKPKAS